MAAGLQTSKGTDVRSRIHRVESRVLGRFLAVLLAVTLTTSALAGCGSEDEPKSTPSPTSKPSVPPGLDTTPPPKPAEAAETKESAAEYGETYNLTFVLPGQGAQTVALTAPPSPPVNLPVGEVQTRVDYVN